MDPRLPFLEISGPDGVHVRYPLTAERVTIGRFPEYNDVALQPDPQQLVSRIAHCILEPEQGAWWLLDNGSRNRTFLCVDGRHVAVEGRTPLDDGTVIHILARRPEEELAEPTYWSLVFRDPQRTRQAAGAPSIAYLEYDWPEARLFRCIGGQLEEIDTVRPQEHQLVRFMDGRNRESGYTAVMCSFDELIDALWGDDGYDHTESDVARVVWGLRQKIEPDGDEPRILQTVRGLGYRLVTRPRSRERQVGA